MSPQLLNAAWGGYGAPMLMHEQSDELEEDAAPYMDPGFYMDAAYQPDYPPMDYPPMDSGGGYPPYDPSSGYSGGSGYPPYDPNIDPSTGLPWGQTPPATTPTDPGNQVSYSTWIAQHANAFTPMTSEADYFAKGGFHLPPNHPTAAATPFPVMPHPSAASVPFAPMPAPPSIANVPFASMPAPQPSPVSRVPMQAPRRPPVSRAATRVMGDSGAGDLLSSLTGIIGKIQGGDKKTQDAVKTEADKKPGGNDQLVNDILTNVIKFAPLLIALAGPSYEDATDESLFMMARKKNKAAVAELTRRAFAGDIYAFDCMKALLGLYDYQPMLMHEQPAMSVQGFPWRMAMDEFSQEQMSPWGMGYEVIQHPGQMGPWGMGASNIPPEYIDDAVNQSQATVEKLMAAAEAGNPTAIEAVKSIYQAAKNGNPRAYAIVMLTANTRAMPYVGASEKSVPAGPAPKPHKYSWYRMGLCE